MKIVFAGTPVLSVHPRSICLLEAELTAVGHSVCLTHVCVTILKLYNGKSGALLYISLRLIVDPPYNCKCIAVAKTSALNKEPNIFHVYG